MSDAKSQPGDGKWVEGLTAETPVGAAARLALKARLGVVIDALRPAADWAADAEPVHQLRVASRRAGAALAAFADLLPAKSLRKVRKALKRLRRAAGVARDADVFIDMVRGWSVHQSPAARPGLHFLLGHAFARRQTAQDVLRVTVEAVGADASQWADNLAEKVHGGRRETLGERAALVFGPLLADFDAAARGNLSDYEQLHRVRILGKKLRYTLELFIGCLSAAAREQVYPLVETVQDILGLANDSHQAVLNLDALLNAVRTTQPGLWELVRGGLEELRTFHHQRVREQRTAFAEWWRLWQSLRPAAVLGMVTSSANSAAEPAGSEAQAAPAAGP
jgi:CHAD domain-containing protein